MSKKEAYLLSLKLWVWLFNNPGKDKNDSPYWDSLKKLYHLCPLCHVIKFCYACVGSNFGGNRFGCFDGAYWKWAGKGYEYKPGAALIASKIRRHCRNKGWLK